MPSPCDAGRHDCAGACVLNTAVTSCGASCIACAVPANGAATCNGTACGFICNAGFHACGAACVSNNSDDHCGASCAACPAPASGHGKGVCVGTAGTYACAAVACDVDYHYCAGATVTAPGTCAKNTNVSACVVCNGQAPDPDFNPCSTCSRSDQAGCNRTCGFDANNLSWVDHGDAATGLCMP